MSIKTKSFTLLEFFCALAITVFIMSVCSIKIHKTVQKKRFFASAKLLENNLKFCQKLAVLYQEDSFFSLLQDKKGISIEMGLSGGRGFLKDFAAETKFFPDLYFQFEEKLPNKFDLGFSSTGKVFPEGQLVVFSKKQELIWLINLEEVISVKDEVRSTTN